MPSKSNNQRTKRKPARGERREIRDEILDELLSDYEKPEDLLGEEGIFDDLKKRLLERVLEGELTEHLGYRKHEARPEGQTNARNGRSSKRVKTPGGELSISLPRDRESSFEPTIIEKGARRFRGFDDSILHLYATGMTVRDIQEHLKTIYKVEVSPTLISSVTEEVLEEVRAWQGRPLDQVYPIVYFDALVARVREGGAVVKKAVYIALGVNLDGQKEVLGMWLGAQEGARFWLGILTELKNRGVEDLFIACVDGLKGFPEAIEAEYPKTKVQLCIVHMVRNSLRYVGWQQRKRVAADLKKVYHASTEQLGAAALDDFEAAWGEDFPLIVKSWRSNWPNLITIFDYPPEIRRIIYTTNAIESLNHSMRKVLKNRKAFPTDEALLKVLYLGLKRASQKWNRPLQKWSLALQRFTIEFGERMPS